MISGGNPKYLLGLLGIGGGNPVGDSYSGEVGNVGAETLAEDGKALLCIDKELRGLEMEKLSVSLSIFCKLGSGFGSSSFPDSEQQLLKDGFISILLKNLGS